MSCQITPSRAQLWTYVRQSQGITDSLRRRIAARGHREHLDTEVVAEIDLLNENVRTLTESVDARDVTLQEGYSSIARDIGRLQEIEESFDRLDEVNAEGPVEDGKAAGQGAVFAPAPKTSRWKIVKESLKMSLGASGDKRSISKRFVEVARGAIRARNAARAPN